MLCVIYFFLCTSICVIFIQCIYSCLSWRKSFLKSCKLHCSSVPLVTRTERFDNATSWTNQYKQLSGQRHLVIQTTFFLIRHRVPNGTWTYETKTQWLVNKNMENTRPMRSFVTICYFIIENSIWLKVRRGATQS